MMPRMQERLTQVKRTLQEMGKQYPDFLEAFQKFKQETEREGAVDVKTKKLVAIALSVVTKCEWCIAIHTKDALEHGAKPGEIMEIVFVASLMGGAPSLMMGQRVMQAIKEFQKKE
ncbi:carboxymuconolactone decarboxylase family protein [Candidatus Bathyarchaeota archaeon]|nr:carboxymuconolactone decarboxylase family protein [Candidatus Bathyarchaeota archaeon]